MSAKHLLPVLGPLVMIALLSADAGAEIARYYTKTTSRGQTRLVGITARRGGRPVTFDAAKLIGVRLVHFKAGDSNSVITAPGAGIPAAGHRGALLSDGLLNSGVINPAGAEKPPTADPVLAGPNATPGMAVEFAEPVVNLPGDDVVVFEFHTNVSSPLGGDAFHVAPLHFEPHLRSITVDRFDFDVDDPRATPTGVFDIYRFDKPAASASELENGSLAKGGSPGEFKTLAVAIDLSTMGYAPGARVKGLFFQDAPGTGLRIDPVEIAGLPAPEPDNLLKDVPKALVSAPEPGELLAEMLDGPMADIDEIVFAVRVRGFDHWYANFGYYSASVTEYPPQRGIPGEEIPPLFGDGGRLCRLNLRTGKLKKLLDDSKGSVRDPQVHYDGRKILFSYRKGGQPYFHLYEINADGTGCTS